MGAGRARLGAWCAGAERGLQLTRAPSPLHGAAAAARRQVARAIEEPFVLSPNGLPLLALQRQLNERLLVAAGGGG